MVAAADERNAIALAIMNVLNMYLPGMVVGVPRLLYLASTVKNVTYVAAKISAGRMIGVSVESVSLFDWFTSSSCFCLAKYS